MTNQLSKQYIAIQKEVMAQLPTIVDETIAFNCHQKSFTAAELWKIQRQKKPLCKGDMLFNNSFFKSHIIFMEKLTNNQFNFNSKEQVDQLKKGVKEGAAVDCLDQKQFSTVDLWSIQSRYKTMLNRRNH